jgi:AraC-like DNA-binding protein
VAKNVFVHLGEFNSDLFANDGLWRLIIYIGLAHQFAIGPLFLLYFNARIKKGFILKRHHFLHFVPYIIVLIISPFIRWNFWADGGLLLSYVSILVYFILAFGFFYRHRNEIDIPVKKWLQTILVITSLMLVSYSPALFYYMGYLGGAMLYAVGVFAVGGILLINTKIFNLKYESSSLNEQNAQHYKSKLESIMAAERPYLNPELTLNTLATMLAMQPHHLSQVINQEFKKSYADYINEFRLQEAVLKLKSPKYQELKIVALAYDAGFNSQPTFNTLFKKKYKSTPSQFRKQCKHVDEN